MIGFGSLFIAAAMTVPSFAAKKVVTDDELDMVTAAGQPVVINGGTTNTVDFSAATSIASVLSPSSQTGLRALILNNVVGENQVQNGVNVASVAGATSSQTNTITQSWGSINDITATTTAASSIAITPVCTGLICKQTGVLSVFSGTVRVLSRAADQIITVGDTSTVTYNPQTAIASDISNDSQTGLVALVVNNVTGLNQVATGINIGNGSIGMGPDLTVGAIGGAHGSQGNVINQFRGTPGNFR
jgi:hypothetical protein